MKNGFFRLKKLVKKFNQNDYSIIPIDLISVKINVLRFVFSIKTILRISHQILQIDIGIKAIFINKSNYAFM